MIRCHPDILTVVHMMIGVQMMLLYGKSILHFPFLRKRNLSWCIIHLYFFAQIIGICICRCQLFRKTGFCIDKGPVGIGPCQLLTIHCLKNKITHSDKSTESIRNCCYFYIFTKLRISLHDHLPCRKYPGSFLFL